MSDMVSGFGNLQYMWSIRVTFLSDTVAGNVKEKEGDMIQLYI